MSSLDCRAARVQASLRANDGSVTAFLEKMGLSINASKMAFRLSNFSLPPQRNKPNGVSLGARGIFLFVWPWFVIDVVFTDDSLRIPAILVSALGSRH